MSNRIFVVFWKFIGWKDLSLGLHICLGEYSIDLHLPFGWLRVGWERKPLTIPINLQQCLKNHYGLNSYRSTTGE